MRRLFYSFAALVSVLALPALADIQNGNFGYGTGNPGVYTTVFAGQTTITDWSVTSGSVDWIGSYWQQPTTSNSYSIDLDGNSAGIMGQSDSFVLGQTYQLIFYLAGNPDGGPTVNTIKTVSVTAGNTTKTFTFDTNPSSGHTSESNMGWTEETLEFTGQGANTIISFTSLDDTNSPYGPAIAAVSAVAVPEAGFYYAFAASLSGLCLFVRRKRQA